MIEALTVLLAFQLAGEMLARGLVFPVPGPVIGLALLFAFLWLRLAVPRDSSTRRNCTASGPCCLCRPVSG